MEEQELSPLSPQEAVRAFLDKIVDTQRQLSDAASDLVRALSQPDESTDDHFESSVRTLNMAAGAVLKTSGSLRDRTWRFYDYPKVYHGNPR